MSRILYTILDWDTIDEYMSLIAPDDMTLNTPDDIIDWFTELDPATGQLIRNIEMPMNIDGDTALLLAVKDGDLDLLTLLCLRCGANINGVRQNGSMMTPLMMAIRYHYPQTIQRIFQLDPLPPPPRILNEDYLRDSNGKTAREILEEQHIIYANTPEAANVNLMIQLFNTRPSRVYVVEGGNGYRRPKTKNKKEKLFKARHTKRKH